MSRFHNMIIKITGLGVIAFLASGLTGCSSPAPRVPDTHYNIEISVPPVNYGIDTTIQLSKLDMRGVQSGRALTIMSAADPIQLQEIRGHYWHSAPARLLKRTISESMDKASQDIRFGTSANMQDPNYNLEIDVRMFAFAPGKDAIVKMLMVLRDRQNNLVMHYMLEHLTPVTGDAPLQGVHGLQDALSQVVLDMSDKLACHVISSKISKSSKC